MYVQNRMYGTCHFFVLPGLSLTGEVRSASSVIVYVRCDGVRRSCCRDVARRAVLAEAFSNKFEHRN